MAFQSHVFENGHWVSTESTLQDVLNKPNTARPTAQTRPPPRCGILTRTVIQSSVAHWILSVRLRSPQHNDVAFVGVSRVPCSL